MYLTTTANLKPKNSEFRSLRDCEVISAKDYIEDLATGKREQVRKSKFYSFLRGQRAGEARELPKVYDVVRKQQ